MKISPISLPPAAPYKDQINNTEKKEAAPISAPSVDIPSGSGLGGATHDEVVSRFVASCPEGSSMNMVKLPTEILVTKGASVLAEVKFHSLSYYPLSSFWQVLTFSSFCRVSNLLWLWKSNC